MSNASTTETDPIKSIHPRENPVEDFIVGSGIAPNKPAVSIGTQPRRISGIADGTRAVTSDTTIWLSLHSGTSEELWTALQTSVERRCKRRALRDQLDAIAPLRSA